MLVNQLQPNRWSCVPAALATLLGRSVSEIIRIIGHDGSDILFEDLPEPQCRQGFHLQECIIAAMRLGFCMTLIEQEPLCLTDETHVATLSHSDWPLIVSDLLDSTDCIVGGLLPNGVGHVEAWVKDERKYYDPNGFIYDSPRVEIYTVLPVWRPSILGLRLE